MNTDSYNLCLVKDPLTHSSTLQPIKWVLSHIASQENYDDEEWDVVQTASNLLHRIAILRNMMNSLDPEIRTAARNKFWEIINLI